MFGTVLVDARGGARELSHLEMKCDRKEIPEFLSLIKPEGWWIAADVTFGGTLQTGGETNDLGESKSGSMKGSAALAVGEGRVIGIMSPSSPAEPAIWWSWPLSELRTEAVGSQGLLKKRPTAIVLNRNGGVDGDGDSLVLKGVGRLYRNSNNVSQGQEASLLKVLQG
jgi:hypothetical protein